jgi:hypothetical protein
LAGLLNDANFYCHVSPLPQLRVYRRSTGPAHC